jgi:hypothetical protein
VREVFYLESGLCKLVRVQADGAETIVGIRGPGWFLAAAAALLEQPYAVTAKTLTRCRIARLGAAQFRSQVRSNADRAWLIHRMHCEEIYLQLTQVAELSSESARQRLIHLLQRIVSDVHTPLGILWVGDTLYVADTETSRIYAWEILSPGKVKHEPFPAPYGGRCVCGLPGFQRFDSLAVEAGGNVAVATLHAGCITVIAPNGKVVRQVTVPDEFPTNICFGGRDLRTAYVTLSATGRLGALDWGEPGLRLNY